ncbi:MAG: CoA transferase [Deltaproteobacteria bacterium]|nr:CoA transferase [Deltaproteobacteria bacterium]MBW1925540.1 CoA transferase [Deltaproteobacteria bacterium]MBW1951250.1 CoA transferase [Deltaproteobacteria bacterium]MBW2009047.1 CoA transferase [Deltaproteobacteria bacterium]MBW2349137.1 CoA transferase [Deltaproteobacteria bacterium]
MNTADHMPLQGVRVLDCTWATGGPYGTLLLAMLGAEVIKVESPPQVTGVSTRQMLFPAYSHEGEDAHFLTYNRNKKSIVIDLRSPEGRDVFYDLVKKSDVVFDNFRPGVMDRLGLGYETLRKVNPRVICTSLSGFGATGPDREKPAFDVIIEASSGVTSLLQGLLPEGVPPPSYPGVSWADHAGGMAAAFATVAALFGRRNTGKGRKIDIAMQDVLLSMMGYVLTGTANFEDFSDPLPSMLWGTFKTRDGHIVLCGHRDGMWRNLARALGREDWLEDTRYETISGRQKHGEELRREVEEVLAGADTAHWVSVLQDAGVPCTAVHTVKEVLGGPQAAARDMVVEVDHKGVKIKTPGNPLKISGIEERFEAPPPLGAHTEELLADLLGYPEEKIAKLREKGIVGP